MLMIDLDTFDDALVEGAEAFTVSIANQGGSVASQISITAPATLNTTINDNDEAEWVLTQSTACLLYTSPSPRDATLSRMPSSA